MSTFLEPSGGSEYRTLTVPDGLAGERLDAALARLFGFSRSRAAELIAAGNVTLDGEATTKSERVPPGALLEVEIPAHDEDPSRRWVGC